MMRIQRSVPREPWEEVQKPREPVDIKPGVDVYLIRGGMVGQVLLPARILAGTTACRVRIDATEIGHAMLTTQYDLRFYEVYQVKNVEGTVVTPERAKLHPRHKVEMGRSNGHTDRHATARKKGTDGEKAEKASVRGEGKRKDYGRNLQWAPTWELKSQYTTPRDTVWHYCSCSIETCMWRRA